VSQLEIISAGPALSIQDLGRPGFCRFGLSKGGAMDPYAIAEGNALLGNADAAASIEMASFGGKFRAVGDEFMAALTGAPMKSTIDGVPIPWRTSFSLKDGQVLDIGSSLDDSGTYGYLHVAGGISVEPEIGSMSTHLRAGIGGVQGKALTASTLLNIAPSTSNQTINQRLPAPHYLGTNRLRILWGMQSERFSSETRERLLNASFSISHRRDRMAMRLAPQDSDEPFEGLLSGLSDPIQDGEIQITGDGVPAIVAREHQPTGGYPRIASVISADLAAAAQLPTGRVFKFQLVSDAEALDALIQWRNDIDQVTAQVQSVIRSPDDIDNLLGYNLIDGVISASDDI